MSTLEANLEAVEAVETQKKTKKTKKLGSLFVPMSFLSHFKKSTTFTFFDLSKFIIVMINRQNLQVIVTLISGQKSKNSKNS